MNHTKLTLGELLSHTNETIRRNAISILKTLQRYYADKHANVTVYRIIKKHKVKNIF